MNLSYEFAVSSYFLSVLAIVFFWGVSGIYAQFYHAAQEFLMIHVYLFPRTQGCRLVWRTFSIMTSPNILFVFSGRGLSRQHDVRYTSPPVHHVL